MESLESWAIVYAAHQAVAERCQWIACKRRSWIAQREQAIATLRRTTLSRFGEPSHYMLCFESLVLLK